MWNLLFGEGNVSKLSTIFIIPELIANWWDDELYYFSP